MVSGYPTSTSLPLVDGLSMDPRVLRLHIKSLGWHREERGLRFKSQKRQIIKEYNIIL